MNKIITIGREFGSGGREVGKRMAEALGVAYYKIADGDDYTEEEADLIIKQMNILGERMAKAVNGKYVTY